MDMPKEIFLKDYKLPDYYFDTVLNNWTQFFVGIWIGLCSYAVFMFELPLQVDLNFLLGEEKTIVHSKITVIPRVQGTSLTAKIKDLPLYVSS